VGNFPGLAEWNDKYSRHGPAVLAGRGRATGRLRLSACTGSSDLYAERRPHASINFVTDA